MGGNCPQVVAVVELQAAERDTAKTVGLLKHGLEHRRKIAGRGVDDAQHLGRRGFSGECLVTLRCALVQLSPRLGKLALKIGHELLRIGW